MQLWNGKPQFVDAYGDRLISGRLIVYEKGTTDLADIWSDELYTVPMLNPIILGSAGWWENQPYAKVSVTCHLQEYVGQDINDEPIYNDVNTFDIISTEEISGNVNVSGVVDVIEDLRNLIPVAGALVSVKGYFDKDDSYVRQYIYEPLNVQDDNGGTIIQSLITPDGRWVLKINDDMLDVRSFGCIPGADDVNSQIRAAQGWATDNKYTLHIPKGTYNLASGGTFDCYCILDVADGVVFNRGNIASGDENTWYKWNLFNPLTKIKGTFAGFNVRLTICGTAWENTVVPITAFSTSGCRGYSHGSANYHLLQNVNNRTYVWENPCNLSKVSVPKGFLVSNYVNNGVIINVDHLEGEGQISFTNTNTWRFRELTSKYVSGHLSYAMQYTRDIVYLDSPVTLHSGANLSCHVVASGLGSLDTVDNTAVMSGGYSGKPNFILSTHGLNVGYHSVLQDYFGSANGLVNTWNLSVGATGDLDMGGASATVNVSKSGKIINGTIASVSGASSIILDRVTVNGNVNSAYITANASVINGQMPNVSVSKLTDTILTSSLYNITPASVWENVTCPSATVSCTGGNAKLKDVSCVVAVLIPNSSRTFENFSWIGGNINTVYFNASLMSVDGEAVANHIKMNVTVANDVLSINGTTRVWYMNGHKDVEIISNKSTTTGRCTGSVTKISGGKNGYGYIIAPIFCFRSDEVLGSAPMVQADYFGATSNQYNGPADVWMGASVLNSPRAFRVSWYGQSGTYTTTGTKVNITWDLYPKQ